MTGRCELSKLCGYVLRAHALSIQNVVQIVRGIVLLLDCGVLMSDITSCLIASRFCRIVELLAKRELRTCYV